MEWDGKGIEPRSLFYPALSFVYPPLSPSNLYPLLSLSPSISIPFYLYPLCCSQTSYPNDSRSRMGSTAGEIEAVDRHPVARPAGNRTHEQDLIQHHLTLT